MGRLRATTTIVFTQQPHKGLRCSDYTPISFQYQLHLYTINKNVASTKKPSSEHTDERGLLVQLVFACGLTP
jgi:hypothetical protein